MTEPSPSRPLPSSDQPVPPSTEPPRGQALVEVDASEPIDGPGAFEDLAGRPVAQHVEIFEAEHARLHDELSTIDQL